MTTTIKITELSDIGANLASSTVIPVVNMAGTPTTEKTVLGNIANVVLAGAGGNYVAAAKANTATTANTVLTNAQPNITSVGTLSNVTVSGNASINGNITSNGTAYLGNISTTGYASITTLTVGSSANLGAVGNVRITGGTNGQVLTTNGSGNLSWTTVSGGSNGTPGGSNTQIQFNDAGSFGGNTGFTFDKTTGIFTSPFVAGNGNGLSNIQGANVSGAVGLATYATTANAVAGANVSGFVPNANVANTAFAVAAANVSGLGNIATINLTGSTSNVLYGNGVFAPASGGGNANTGNVTFNNINIIGTGNLHLQPDPANSGSYLDIFISSGPDLHLVASDNANLILGKDNQANVMTSWNGNVYVQSWDTGTGNAGGTWTFDGDGNLTTAGDLVGPVNANFTIHSNAGAHEFIFGGDGTFYAPDNVVLGGNSIYIGPGASTLSGIEHEVFIASSNLFPYVQAVVNNISDNGSADWVALGARGGDAGGQASLGFTSSGFGDANYTITGNGDGYVLVQSYAPGQTLLGGGGNLVLATGNQGSVKDIIFGTGGFLTSNIFGRISHANNSLEISRTGASLKFPDGTTQTTAYTGGGANTGNVTFNNQIVLGTGSNDGSGGLYLAPGNASIANSAVQYLRVRGGDFPTHIHLDTGNNEYYDQYFGADSRYVKLEANGNIVINADDYAGNSGTWSFTTDGNLILAGGNSVIQSIANSSLDPVNPNVSTMVLTPDSGYGSQALVLDPTAPGHIHLRAPGANIDEPSANIFLGGEDSSFEVGYYNGSAPNVFIHSGGNTWTFGNDGTTTFPTGNITSNTSLQFTTTFANVNTIEYQTAGVWDVYVEDTTTGPNDAWSWINVTFKDNLIDKPEVFIENQKANDGIAQRWTFDENGILNFPRDVAGNTDPYLSIEGGAIPKIQSTDVSLGGPANLAISADYLNLSGFSGDKIVFYADTGEMATDANMTLTTNLANTGNTYSWTFGDDGRLTFPGTPRIDTSTNNFEVQAAEAINFEANTVVNIYTDSGNTAYQWQFGDDGVLTVPGNLAYIGASPAPSINGFNSANFAGNVTGGNISTTGNISGNTNGFTIGYLNIPQVAAANATLALTDAGKHYYSTTAGNFTLTVPNNATTAFATGTAISIVVQAAGNILVNADTGVTLYMAGNSTAANRVVGGYGMATLMKVGTDTWFINGTGVS